MDFKHTFSREHISALSFHLRIHLSEQVMISSKVCSPVQHDGFLHRVSQQLLDLIPLQKKAARLEFGAQHPSTGLGMHLQTVSGLGAAATSTVTDKCLKF